MKHIHLFEARKKTADPFYDLAVAIKDYLVNASGDDMFKEYDPVIKYYYSSVQIKTIKYNAVLVIINTFLNRDRQLFTVQEDVFSLVFQNEEAEALILKALEKYPRTRFYDAFRFQKSDLQDIINDLNLLISANNYNL